MSHDIFQSVPQRSIGAQDAENSRIEAIANELRRRSQLYEAERGESQPHVSSLEIEQRVTEVFAKENALWHPVILRTESPLETLLVRHYGLRVRRRRTESPKASD